MNRIRQIRLTPVFLILLLTFLCAPVASVADSNVLISGSVKTEDGIAVKGMTLNFRQNADQSVGTSVKLNADGTFLAQLPAGDYFVNLSSIDRNQCLSGSFETSISETSKVLNVVLPKTKTYEFSFVTPAGQFVPGVRVDNLYLQFRVPSNPNLKNVRFSCTSNGVFTSAVGEKYLWPAFEASSDVRRAWPDTMHDMTRYSYSSGLGQDTNVAMPMSGWVDGKFSVVISDLPSITMSTKGSSISKNHLKAVASFVEVPAFASFSPERTFRTAVRIGRGGKWTQWIVGSGYGKTGLMSKGGQVPVDIRLDSYKGSTLQVALLGKGFTAVNNYATFKIPK